MMSLKFQHLFKLFRSPSLTRHFSEDACNTLPPIPKPSCDPPPPFPGSVITWLEEMCDFLLPSCMHIMDGTQEERMHIANDLIKSNVAIPLKEDDGCLYIRSEERDDGRNMKRVFTAACDKFKFIPETAQNCKYGPLLGNTMPALDADEIVRERFRHCMKGKKMYVIPFMLGPKDAEKKLFGIQLTDSGLAALITSMIVRIGNEPQTEMVKEFDGDDGKDDKFIKIIHSAGNNPCAPPHWPHDPEKYIIINMPDRKTVYSYGSSHWDNSVLVKDTAALQFAQYLLTNNNIMPLNMSVLSIEKEGGNIKYIGIMGAPGSGKSILASLTGKTDSCPLNGKMVSDDVSWIKVDCKLMAINPLTGFMPLVRGVNETNTPKFYPLATKNSILLNTALSANDSAWWEGKKFPNKDDLAMTDWRGKKWRRDGPRAAHVHSRFLNTWKNMDELDPRWESGYGVPLDAIIILTRRNKGHPLIFETLSWSQAVYHMATIRSRHHNSSIDKDEVHWEPFGKRHCLGYNLGKMIGDWMSFQLMEGSYKPQFPRVFAVNLFLMDPWAKEPMWSGYEDNSAIINWILDRIDSTVDGEITPIGILPFEEDFVLPENMQYTFKSVSYYDSDYWLCEFNHIEDLIMDQLPIDIPELFSKEFFSLKKNILEDEEKKTSSENEKKKISSDNEKMKICSEEGEK